MQQPMIKSRSLTALILAVTAVTALAPAVATPAAAGGWHSYRYDAPRTYRRSYRSRAYDSGVRYYNSPRAYRSACGYGDCVCLRNMALSTGNPVWWDKYQACAG